jgi:hypothetical protein
MRRRTDSQTEGACAWIHHSRSFDRAVDQTHGTVRPRNVCDRVDTCEHRASCLP